VRQPNELWISIPLLEEVCRIGFKASPYRVKEGPSAEARIIGVRMEPRLRCVVLEYDRPVDDAVLTTETLPLLENLKNKGAV
jgi:hypothetical protein